MMADLINRSWHKFDHYSDALLYLSTAECGLGYKSGGKVKWELKMQPNKGLISLRTRFLQNYEVTPMD